MSRPAFITRFAPSPSGQLHLGNARTALFNLLAARAGAGRLILRIEDTDTARSTDEHATALLEDLRWLGLSWEEGPDVGGPAGPYRQSQRADLHAAAMQRLAMLGLAYPCFCTAEELQLRRRLQLAAGRPPRYAGTCAGLAPQQVAERRNAGTASATRFRVPAGRMVEFVDAVHGLQRFSSDDIGDFVIGRHDGSASFFLSNAVDDGLMGVSLVLRGDDHLANTPRQILLLQALGLPVPDYGHLPLVLDTDGQPLSKRTGAASLADLRARGYLPLAICNYLARLGHSAGTNTWQSLAALGAEFRLERISRSAARFDEDQLRHWQRVALTHASDDEIAAWLGPRVLPVAPALRAEFVHAVRGNLLFPDDVLPLLCIVGDEDPEPGPEARAAIAAAGEEFFATAGTAWQTRPQPFREWARALGEASGRRGAALFGPLRAALTGATHGPELAPLLPLIGRERVARRLARAAGLAQSTATEPAPRLQTTADPACCTSTIP